MEADLKGKIYFQRKQAAEMTRDTKFFGLKMFRQSVPASDMQLSCYLGSGWRKSYRGKSYDGAYPLSGYMPCLNFTTI